MTIQKKKRTTNVPTNNTDEEPKAGRPFLGTNLVRLQRRVAFDYCRDGLGWPTIENMAIRLEYGDAFKQGEVDVSSAWNAYARGEHDPIKRRVELMEKAVRGTTRMRHHDFWLFLGNVNLSNDKLISIVQRLPHDIVTLLLSGPEPEMWDASVQVFINDEDCYAVQSVGNLTAVAALFATAELLMRKEEYIGKEESISRTMRAAGRLLVRISLIQPLQRHFQEIWKFLKQRYPQYLELAHFGSSRTLFDDYQSILNVSEAFGINPPSWPERRWLLSIADRGHFDVIAKAARRAVLFRKGEKKWPALEGPLDVLFYAYQHIFCLPVGNAWFGEPPYPVEELKRYDKLISQAVID